MPEVDELEQDEEELPKLAGPQRMPFPDDTGDFRDPEPTPRDASVSAPAAPPPTMGKKMPTPTETRTGADESEMNRLRSTGSGISQVKNPVGRGLLRGLNVAGSIMGAVDPFARRILPNIPGTEEHHRQLMGQQQGRLNEDLGDEQKEQQAANEATTGREAQARIPLLGAQTREANANAAAKEHPAPKEGLTPEETTIHDIMTGEGGQPRINPQTQKPYSYLEAYQAVKQAGQDVKPEPKQNDFEQFYSDYIKDNNLPDSAHNRLMARKEFAKAGQAPQHDQRQLAVGPDGKIVELTPGMDASGVQSLGGMEKSGAANQGGHDALAYANDYMTQKHFTGPGDEALMEKFFELAKPSSGFRMTQAQIEMLQKARDLMGGFEAKAKHLFTPDAPYFSDEQRKQIVETMTRLENAKGSTHKPAATSNEPTRPANVPQGYVYKENGPKGTGWYRP